MKTLLTAIIVAAITGHFAYQHGFYVGKLDAEANRGALQQAGYTPPFHVDSVEPTRWSE